MRWDIKIKQKSFRRKKAKVRSFRRKNLDLDNTFFNFVFPEFETEYYKKSKLGKKLKTLYHQGY